MPPRFDPDQQMLEISVADLVDADLRRNLGFSQRGGYERLWLGQAIHRTYQEEALASDGSYKSELPIVVETGHGDWGVTIRGRIDGLRTTPEGAVIVEEIKSVRRGDLSSSVRQIYERQALVYAWMLDVNGETVGGAELVLIEIGSHSVERHVLDIDLEATERRVRSRIASLIVEFDLRREKAERRKIFGKDLSFPYPDIRPGQDRIIERVEDALERGQHLLLEAPTGIGKTAATLYPVLRFALQHDKRVFVLTAKTLQQDMATTVLDMLNPEQAFHSLRLRAKRKMCANGEVICHEEFCPFARDYFLKLHNSNIVDQLLEAESTLRPLTIYDAAEGAQVCPFEVSLELTERAEAVVCDYNYAFDPYVALRSFGGDEDLDDVILVIDEMHNLVDRGRGYYSPELVSRQAALAADSLLRSGHPQRREIAETCRELERLVTRTVAEALDDAGHRVTATEIVLADDDFWLLRPDFDTAFLDYLEYQRETASFRADDLFVDLYFTFLRFLDGLMLSSGDAFSQYVEFVDGEASIRILCKDPSRYLGGILNRTYSAIGLSGTLSPPEFYRELLGFDEERTLVERVSSPFPRENRCVVIDDSVSTLYRERDSNYQPIANGIRDLAKAVPGNCLVLFPSYSFLNRVASRLGSVDKQVLLQNSSDSDEKREELLAALRSPLLGDVLLLAVAGGVFSEGVDYPGETLRAVAVVGPCLPAVSLERELLRQYYEERFGRGFEYSFVVPGMTRVVQAAGRLIRSADDTGILALFDKRFLQPPYRHHLPEEWLEGEDVERLVGAPGRAAEAFFAGLCQ
jgi:DNA excision repair protein ERCC-2